MASRSSMDTDELDTTSQRVLYDIPEIVDAADSIEMTAQQLTFNAGSDSELTAERSPLVDPFDSETPLRAPIDPLELDTPYPNDLDGPVIEVEADLPDTPFPTREESPADEDDEPDVQVGRPLLRRLSDYNEPEVTAPRNPAIASRDSLPASSAAEGRRGSIASRDSLPASSAAEGRRGSIGTPKKLARKDLDSSVPHEGRSLPNDRWSPNPSTNPGETFERLETRTLDEFMEPTGIRQPMHEVEDRPTTNLDPGERGLLAAIAEGSEVSRLKYADWLHRHGESARAEFLRVDCELAKSNPNDPKFQVLLERRLDLSSRISVDWRSRVSRAPIEGCAAFNLPCPGRWAALSATEGDDIRSCSVCQKTVYYCATIQLAQGRVRNGDPVAIDVTCQRWPGDLGGTCVQCNSFVPSEARFCPHCGQSVQLVMMGTV